METVMKRRPMCFFDGSEKAIRRILRLKFSGGIVISTASTKKCWAMCCLLLPHLYGERPLWLKAKASALWSPSPLTGREWSSARFAYCRVALLSSRSPKNSDGPVGHRKPNKAVLIGGIICGAVIFVAANLQQFGIENGTTAENPVITALYVVMVPVVSIFLKKKSRPKPYG